MALGKKLRDAREAKGYSASEVAEATNMMVQMVEELEQEDFHRIAAPIYGKGFIRLFAEYVELDPAPLIEDFMSLYSGGGKPSIKSAATGGRGQPEADETVTPISLAAKENAEPDSATTVPVGSQRVTEPASSASAPSGTHAVEPDVSVAQSSTPDQPAAVSPAAPAIEKPGEPDLFNYSRDGRDGKIKPSLRLGGGREDSQKAERAARTESDRKQAALRRQNAIANLKQLGRALGSFGILLKKLFGKMPLRDVAVVVAVLVMLALIVFGINRCSHLSDGGAGGAKPDQLNRRVISPPDPYVD